MKITRFSLLLLMEAQFDLFGPAGADKLNNAFVDNAFPDRLGFDSHLFDHHDPRDDGGDVSSHSRNSASCLMGRDAPVNRFAHLARLLLLS